MCKFLFIQGAWLVIVIDGEDVVDLAHEFAIRPGTGYVVLQIYAPTRLITFIRIEPFIKFKPTPLLWCQIVDAAGFGSAFARGLVVYAKGVCMWFIVQVNGVPHT
jgi:hypothetical protein